MLSKASRLTAGPDFAATIRRGSRAGTRTLVVHLVALGESPERGPRVGFVVSKAVGNAVARNRVRRRLRHLVASRLTGLPAAGMLVVRALPAAAAADSATLGADLDAALRRTHAFDGPGGAAA
ncbi:MAG TPA: ribonuclease P protein component [Nocardioidaceae bacterium]|nr:ribonuclease P protein component [Nocardioidaceae bacterium]